MLNEIDDYGLKHRILSPTETVAQSLSSTAPTAGPTVLIPLVYGLSGAGTWLVFLIALCGVVLVAININTFARRTASPGSLYQYVASSMGAAAGVTAGWALVIAYIGTAAAVTGGLAIYFNAALSTLSVNTLSVWPALIIAFSVIAAWALAWMNVQLSARTMLWFEVLSIALIATLLAMTLFHAGFHFDRSQLRLEGVSPEKLRLGLVLATFAFVGFESSTALGAEVKNPLRVIPRAVIATAVFAGLFFVVSAYVEVLGFKGLNVSLATSSAPLETLAKAAGIGGFGVAIAICAVVSFFACTLACITAAARILFMIGRHGLLPASFGKAHVRNRTPHQAVTLSALFTLLPAVFLALRGFGGMDINGWTGTFATYGFVTAYVLVCVAAPLSLKRRGKLHPRHVVVSAAAIPFMVVTLLGNIYPRPPAPYSWMPFAYAGCLAVGPLRLAWRRRVAPALIEEIQRDLDLAAPATEVV
jgi:amino acid transporter